MATLVHDDMLDGAALRRGRPTAWAVYGEHAAKAVGDHLFARAFAELARTRDAPAVVRAWPTPASRWPAARPCSAARRSARTRPSRTTCFAAR